MKIQTMNEHSRNFELKGEDDKKVKYFHTACRDFQARPLPSKKSSLLQCCVPLLHLPSLPPNAREKKF